MEKTDFIADILKTCGADAELAEKAGAKLNEVFEEKQRDIRARLSETQSLADNFERELSETKERYEKKLFDAAVDRELERKLDHYGAKSARVVSALIDRSRIGISEDDGAVTGISEQLDALMENEPYLFREKSFSEGELRFAPAFGGTFSEDAGDLSEAVAQNILRN